MQTIYVNSQNLAYWKTLSTPNVMALGFFDGVHLGHQKVIQTARAIAEEKGVQLAIMTFFPHPKTVLLGNDTNFDYIMPLSKKLSILASLGVDTCYVVKFDKDFLALSPKQFVENYLLDMNVCHAVAGFDFTYGHKGAGNIDRLKRDASHQMDVTKVEKLDYFGKKVSSTWIREVILQGEIEILSTTLGRFYETEASWDGECFQLTSYYTLPAPGTYNIAININGMLKETEVVIPLNEHAIYFKERPEDQLLVNERYEIIWFQQTSITQELYASKAFIV